MIEVLRNKTPVARKEHRCEFCGEVIHVGEKYNRQSNVYDGRIYDWVSHCVCSKLAYELDMFDDCIDGDIVEDFDNVICSFYRRKTATSML